MVQSVLTVVLSQSFLTAVTVTTAVVQAAGFMVLSYMCRHKTLQVTGEMRSYEHQSDQGSTMTKYFCPSCGSHMIGSNSRKPERRSVWVGVIDDASWFKPQAYLYASKKLPHTPVDPEVEAFDKMPV